MESQGQKRLQTAASDKPKKAIASPDSKENCIKKYMQSIGSDGVNFIISSPTAKMKEVGKEPSKSLPKGDQPIKKQDIKAAEPPKKKVDPAKKTDKSSKTKETAEPDKTTKSEESAEQEKEEDLDESNNPPAGCDKLPDKRFEEIFKGN